MAQVDTISAGFMPQMLQNSENLLNFVTRFGVKIYNIKTKEISFTQGTERGNISDIPSTSKSNPYLSKIITGDLDDTSFSSEETNFTETSSACTPTQSSEQSSGIPIYKYFLAIPNGKLITLITYHIIVLYY